jgi:PKD repeat protein
MYLLVKQKPDISFTDLINQFATDPFNNCSGASLSNQNFSITVGNTSTSTCISSFSINWGDGNNETNVTFPISHSYTQIGVYSMTITALGSNGCNNTKTFIVKNVSNPLGGINSPGSPKTMCPTQICNFLFQIS